MAITRSIKCKIELEVRNSFKVSYSYTDKGKTKTDEENIAWHFLKAIPNKFLKDWAEELKKENYPQTKYSLCSAKEDGTYGYCCLGVACKLRGYTDDYLYKNSLLSEGDMKDGLTRIPKTLRVEDDSNMFFANLNDDHNFTFPQIALVIEEIIKFKEKE